MYKVLIKKGLVTAETNADANYSEFYLELYRNIQEHLEVCIFVVP